MRIFDDRNTSPENTGAVIISLSFFAFFYAAKHDGPLWHFVLRFAINLGFMCVAFYIGTDAYIEAWDRQDHPMGKVQALFFHVYALCISLLTACFFRSLIGR